MSKLGTKFLGRRAFRIAALLILGLFSRAFAATVFPVRFGMSSSVFGTNEKQIERNFVARKAREFMAFTEKNGASHPDEVCHGSVSYSKSGFVIGLFVHGKRRAKIEDCGGSFSFAIRTSPKNSPADGAPVLFHYSLEHFPEPPPIIPTFGFFHNESAYVHSVPVRYSFGTPSYGSSKVCVLDRPPGIYFHPLPNGWAIYFSFRWLDFQERIPFVEGQYPTTWRLTATRTRADGTVATWGTLADPVMLSWGRPGDDFVDKVSMNYFMLDCLGKRYRAVAEFLRQDWTTYRQERWIGLLDPGVPTFEKKNSESDDVFFTHCVGPILDSNENVDKAIYHNVDSLKKEYIPRPPVADFSKAERRAIVAKLDRLIFLDEVIDDARRDYLVARFFNEPVPEYVVDKAAQPKKLKKLDAGRELSEDDLSLDGLEGFDIELDDVGF